MSFEQGKLILYQSDDGNTRVDVQLKDETVWLSQAQMTELFSRNKRTVSEHIRNVFKEGELQEKVVVRKFRITALDGKKYQTNYYNLDVIISVGYSQTRQAIDSFKQELLPKDEATDIFGQERGGRYGWYFRGYPTDIWRSGSLYQCGGKSCQSILMFPTGVGMN